MNTSSKTNPDYMVLLNEDNALPQDFESTVEIISVTNAFGEAYSIEKKTYEAFKLLRDDLMKNDGIQTELISVYRTINDQIATFNEYVAEYGLEYAKKYVAKPGHSEHHTGFAIDVGVVVDGVLIKDEPKLLTLTDIYDKIQAKLPDYGFILRYPKGKESITKIAYECWHFRYIDSPETAKEITGKSICFEEYFEQV